MIKYDTEGNFQWVKEPQPEPSESGWGHASSGELYVTPNGTLHWQVLLNPYTTLEDGNIESESVHFPHSGFWDEYVGDVGVIRYDKDGNLLGYTRLDIAMHGRIGTNIGSEIPFAYDPVLERYYIAAYYKQSGTLMHPAIIDGVETSNFYMAAFNATDGSLLWWHMGEPDIDTGHIRSLDVDSGGNIYTTGSLVGQALPQGNTFAGYTNTDPVASCPLVIVLDSNGDLLWGNNPDKGGPSPIEILVNEDEVLVGMGMAAVPGGGDIDWQGLEYYRPPGHGIDPVTLRFDKQTGNGVAAHDIVGAGLGDSDYITALAVDKLGNIVVGGILTSPYIFDDHPVVDEVWREGISKTDFFIAQLAKAGVSCDDEWVGVDDINKTSLQLYPNPAGETLHWEGDVDLTQITLYDLSGRVVLAQTVSGTSGALSIHTLSSGTYIVVLRDAAGTQLQQVLLKK